MTKTIALDIALDASAEPPKEFRLFAKGAIETQKGVFLFDDVAGQAVMAAANDFGNDYPVDYGHAMWNPPYGGDPAETGKAAGWFKPELRDGELWATSVSWTPRGAKALADREYRYCSPTFRTDDGGRIRELINVALTNLPATKRMNPLVLDRRNPDDGPPASTEVRPMKSLLVALGLPETTTEAEAVVLASKQRELVALTGKTNVGEALGVVTAWKEAASRAEGLSAELAKLKTDGIEREVVSIVDEAVKAGKATPAQREFLLGMGRQDAARLKGFLDASPVIAAATGQKTPPAQAGGAVTEEELKVAKMLGLDPKKMTAA
jgi:phage I-like protein